MKKLFKSIILSAALLTERRPLHRQLTPHGRRGEIIKAARCGYTRTRRRIQRKLPPSTIKSKRKRARNIITKRSCTSGRILD
ncbi:hypothetical protein QNN00_14395 [Bacillus velezensis]|nr:hypothetical protein [Bacillus velezensis]